MFSDIFELFQKIQKLIWTDYYFKIISNYYFKTNQVKISNCFKRLLMIWADWGRIAKSAKYQKKTKVS